MVISARLALERFLLAICKFLGCLLRRMVLVLSLSYAVNNYSFHKTELMEIRINNHYTDS